MLPRLMHLLGKDQRARLPDQGVAVPANPVEPGAHAGEDGAARLPLGGNRAERPQRGPAGRARQQCIELPSTQHVRLPRRRGGCYSTVQSVSVEMSLTKIRLPDRVGCVQVSLSATS